MEPVYLLTFSDSKQTQDELVQALTQYGYAFARGVSFSTLQKACALLGEFEAHPDADKETYFTDITADSSNLSYPDGSDALPLHTDGSAVDRVPNVLVTYCVNPARHGGASYFADGHAVYDFLQSHHQDICTQLTNTPVTFGNPDLGQFKAPIFEKINGKIHFRFRDDGFLFYDESLTDAVTLLKEILQTNTFEVLLESEEVYFVDNTRVAHGRSAFDGDRHVQRALIHSTLV